VTAQDAARRLRRAQILVTLVERDVEGSSRLEQGVAAELLAVVRADLGLVALELEQPEGHGARRTGRGRVEVRT
jgi:hypothetical protein